MTELHPSSSAIGTHLDEQTEIAALARHYYEEEGCPEGRAQEHWARAEREVRGRYAAAPPTGSAGSENREVEEAMHLGQ